MIHEIFFLMSLLEEKDPLFGFHVISLGPWKKHSMAYVRTDIFITSSVLFPDDKRKFSIG